MTVPNNNPQAPDADPFSLVKPDRSIVGLSAREINRLHEHADVDKSPNAMHHRLGTNRNQASPGDHVHDGKASRKIGVGLNLTVTGARGGNAALTSLLAALAQVMDFTDSTTP